MITRNISQVKAGTGLPGATLVVERKIPTSQLPSSYAAPVYDFTAKVLNEGHQPSPAQ